MMHKWQCEVCGYIYDESAGIPEDGIAPGTPWDQVPEEWLCPECEASKEAFSLEE